MRNGGGWVKAVGFLWSMVSAGERHASICSQVISNLIIENTKPVSVSTLLRVTGPARDAGRCGLERGGRGGGDAGPALRLFCVGTCTPAGVARRSTHLHVQIIECGVAWPTDLQPPLAA
jgi:hypothetical protein